MSGVPAAILDPEPDHLSLALHTNVHLQGGGGEEFRTGEKSHNLTEMFRSGLKVQNVAGSPCVKRGTQ